MKDSFFSDLMKWFALSIAVGVSFGVIWAVTFRNNDKMFVYHWAAVPMATLIMTLGGLWSLRKSK